MHPRKPNRKSTAAKSAAAAGSAERGGGSGAVVLNVAKNEEFLRKLSGESFDAAAAPSSTEPTPTGRDRSLHKSASLEHLRGVFLQEAP